MTDLSSLTAASIHIAEQHPDLKLLILFGSRARGDYDLSSDWDIAFLDASNPSNTKPYWFPGADLLITLSNLLQISEDRIDLVDLSTCSDILSHFIARDGQLIYERYSGIFEHFHQRAIKSSADLREFRQTQHQKILSALNRWGV